MITKNTKTTFPIYDVRQNLIGNFIIKLTIDELNININHVTPKGYYYYEDNGEVKILDRIKETPLLWTTVRTIEDGLSIMEGQYINDLLFERLADLTLVQLTQESGQNWGTVPSDWE